MRYQIFHCDGDLESFLKLVREVRDGWPHRMAHCVGEEETPWYRGQSNASWGLMPKIYRPQFAHADEKELRHEFQSAGLQLVGTTAAKDDWNWYFLMQH